MAFWNGVIIVAANGLFINNVAASSWRKAWRRRGQQYVAMGGRQAWRISQQTDVSLEPASNGGQWADISIWTNNNGEQSPERKYEPGIQDETYRLVFINAHGPCSNISFALLRHDCRALRACLYQLLLMRAHAHRAQRANSLFCVLFGTHIVAAHNSRTCRFMGTDKGRDMADNSNKLYNHMNIKTIAISIVKTAKGAYLQ